MSTGTNSSTKRNAISRGQNGVAVSDLVSDEALDKYGYLSLPTSVMQGAGSAAQTVAGIRSHWGRATYADERTIAVASCLDESTVRKRHLPKLFKMGWMNHRMIPSPQGHRREWFFHITMAAAGYWSKQSVTLPRWAALLLPEWSQRAVYAVVLQRGLATARGSQNGAVPLDTDQVLWGGYGRHNFSLTHLCDQTGLHRNAVFDAKNALLESDWLTCDAGFGRGHQLFLNCDKIVPAKTLQEAHLTTRKMMFSSKKQGTNGHE